METLKMNDLGLVELNESETTNLSGGFFPIVIFGIYLSAKAVAGIIIATGVVGVGVGAYIASQE